MNYIPAVGDLLIRPKAFSFVDHVGVVAGPNAVFHNTPEEGEHLSTIDDFAAGKPATAIRTGVEPSSVRKRILNALARPKKYNAVTRNCEHSASDVLLGIARSPQLIAVLVVVGLLVLAFALARR